MFAAAKYPMLRRVNNLVSVVAVLILAAAFVAMTVFGVPFDETGRKVLLGIVVTAAALNLITGP
ncbi:MAG: hypothetical protein GC129_01710 [Proteobacteria bacterium]|nr:hypothetical protein [Pseudomonadota bacterium]